MHPYGSTMDRIWMGEEWKRNGREKTSMNVDTAMIQYGLGST